MRMWMKVASAGALIGCLLLPVTPLSAQPPGTTDKQVTDAWTTIENEQIWLAMEKILDEDTHLKLRQAAQVRLGLDDDGGERFMDCIRNLSAHPDYTAAKVKVAFVVCEKVMAPARE